MFPLEGMKVLDLTRLIPGGFATLILADLGAEVLKIEDTNSGDYARWIEPDVGGFGCYFAALNRNKKSIRLNLKTEQGKEIFKKLIKNGYDIIVESFRPGVMDRLGIGYSVLKEINPGVIYCAITGYGQTGPKRKRALHDLNCMSVSGLLGITGEDLPPIPGIADAASSLFSVIAILGAFISREKDGKGRFIDVSMTESVISFFSFHLVKYMVDGKLPEVRNTDFTGKFPCYEIYKTKDERYISVAILEEKFWRNFCLAVGREDLVEKQYDSSKETKDEVARIFQSKTRSEWEQIAEKFDFCLEPVLNFKEVLNHPQLRYRNLFFEINHGGKKIPQIRLPFIVSELDRVPANPPPVWGENTEEVLTSLGYSREEIESLKEKGVI
ncbi:MAG: CoA transferase [Deltaproteobacteria bacterium]|jgi:alpha-methylacyl-CoA racemase|nr:MAG: CoA transferase [Deltaproteobacteria bacterium]